MAEGKDPRVIQPRSPRFNISVGVWLKPQEKPVFRAIDKTWGSTTVFKGYNALENGTKLRQKFDRVKYKYGSCVMMGVDAHRFDQHVSLEALEIEHDVYVAVAKYGKRELRELLNQQLWNRGVGKCKDGSLKYITRGCRMSGDMNTSLGNCLLMCMLFRLFYQEFDIEGELANNGDDCVLFVSESSVKKVTDNLSSWFLDFGFEMVMEAPVTIFERMEFCQTHVVFDGVNWISMRNFPTFIDKDCNTVLPLHQGDYLYGYAGAISDCGMALAGGLPIAQSFYQALNVISKGLRVKLVNSVGWECGFVNLSRGMSRRVSDVPDSARVSFYKAFGILPDHQIEIERLIGEWGAAFERDGGDCHLRLW